MGRYKYWGLNLEEGFLKLIASRKPNAWGNRGSNVLKANREVLRGQVEGKKLISKDESKHKIVEIFEA